MQIVSRAGAAVSAALLISTPASAASDPNGIWFDHNGRGAVEIKECASGVGLCGYVVHVKEQRNADRCGLQILGNVTDSGGGWIYSPERKRKYDVSLKRLSDDKLRVVGNAGSRFFSRSFTWTRAPDDVARCGEASAAAPAGNADAKPAAAVANAAGSVAPPQVAPVQKAIGDEETKAVAGGQASAPSPPDKAKKSTDAGTETAAASDQVGKNSGGKRTCTYRIPYVGRTVSVPCRN